MGITGEPPNRRKYPLPPELRVTGVSCHRAKAGYALDKSSGHRRAAETQTCIRTPTHTNGQLRVSSSPHKYVS